MEVFEGIPGISKAWQFRGRVHMVIDRSAANLVKHLLQDGFAVTENWGNKLLVRSRWIHPTAEAKQREVQNARITKPLREQHYINLVNSLKQWAQDPDPRLDRDISDEERCEIEDELDHFNPQDLSVAEGYVGHQYKEDLDLERAGKLL